MCKYTSYDVFDATPEFIVIVSSPVPDNEICPECNEPVLFILVTSGAELPSNTASAHAFDASETSTVIVIVPGDDVDSIPLIVTSTASFVTFAAVVTFINVD